MIKNVIALPYELARLPFVLLGENIGERLPESSRPRVALDRAIGSADRLAGTVLHNPGIAQRGAERLDRTEKLATAARLEHEASQRRAQAEDAASAGREEAARKRAAAQQHADSGLQEADAAEAEAKQQARDEAAEAAARKKAAADEKAASRAAAVEQRKEHAEAAAEAERAAARRQAKDDLDAARETSQAADEARVDAERLEDLTESKKQARKQD